MRRGIFVSIITAALLLCAAPADATFPGENGKIAYYTVPSNREPFLPDIYTVDPAGSGQTRLTNDYISHFPVWSPDGQTILFVKSWDEFRIGTRSEIHKMNPDGSAVTQLTTGTLDFQPTWSHDGRRIAFTSLRDELDPNNCRAAGCNWEIYVMNADGSGETRLTNSPGSDSGLSWSPDGTRIAFTTSRDGNSEIYTMNADGNGLVRLTNDPSDDASPQWSPAGDEISFERGSDTYFVRPDGTGERRLVSSGSFYNRSAVWSPDGQRLAFVTYRLGQPQIHVINADGTGEIALTNDQADNDTYGIFNAEPTWSPDGRKVVFTHRLCSVYCGGSQLQTINADGGGSRTAIVHLHAAAAPDWQPLPNRPPDCSSVAGAPSSLSHHGFQVVTLGGATDPDGDAVTVTITGVTQDEPVGRRPDARAGASADRVELRGQRLPRGDGRVYRTAFRASDGTDECSGEATVEVRRKKNQPAVDSEPPSYDSFGG